MSTELVMMVGAAMVGSCSTYIAWCVVTMNGERTKGGTHCWWCGSKKRRSYYEQRRDRGDGDTKVVRLRRSAQQ
jgi:hypothetical protein